MTTAIAIEDVRREVKMLKALSGHKHLVKFYDAYEDANNVYIVMEYVFLVIQSHFTSTFWFSLFNSNISIVHLRCHVCLIIFFQIYGIFQFNVAIFCF